MAPINFSPEHLRQHCLQKAGGTTEPMVIRTDVRPARGSRQAGTPSSSPLAKLENLILFSNMTSTFVSRDEIDRDVCLHRLIRVCDSR